MDLELKGKVALVTGASRGIAWHQSQHPAARFDRVPGRRLGDDA